MSSAADGAWAAEPCGKGAPVPGAEAPAQKAMALAPTDTALMRRASDLAARRGNMGAALDLARKAIATKPLEAVGHTHLAGLLLQAGDLEAAEAAARRAVELAPADAAVRKRLDYITVRRTL